MFTSASFVRESRHTKAKLRWERRFAAKSSRANRRSGCDVRRGCHARFAHGDRAQTQRARVGTRSTSASAIAAAAATATAAAAVIATAAATATAAAAATATAAAAAPATATAPATAAATAAAAAADVDALRLLRCAPSARPPQRSGPPPTRPRVERAERPTRRDRAGHGRTDPPPSNTDGLFTLVTFRARLGLLGRGPDRRGGRAALLQTTIRRKEL